jgi:hypothetical protein
VIDPCLGNDETAPTHSHSAVADFHFVMIIYHAP